MAIADIIPRLDDKELSNLRDNALRLSGSDDARKQEQAADLLPTLEAEIARRLTLVPPKAAKPRTKAAIAAAAAAAAAAEAEEDAEEVEEDDVAEIGA